MTTALPEHLTCRELVEVVTDYLEGQLPLPERTQFEQHLLLCGGCSDYVGQLRAQIGAVGRLADKSIEEPMREKLLDAFRTWKRSGSAR
jgi:anti-sigma factor RsiW